MTMYQTIWLLFQSIMVGVGVAALVNVFLHDRPDHRYLVFIAGWCWMCATISINFRVFS